MSARYIKKGLFHVTWNGHHLDVLARTACDALCIAARIWNIGYELEAA